MTLSKSQKQRDKKRNEKVASKDLKKAQLANVLASLQTLTSQKALMLTFQDQLVSAKTFDLNRVQKAKPRSPKKEKEPSPEVSEEEASVDSFYTKPVLPVQPVPVA